MESPPLIFPIASSAQRPVAGTPAPRRSPPAFEAPPEPVSLNFSPQALAQLAQLPRGGREPGQRIQEAKERLERLLQRMQRAALMGDARSVAAIARETAGLAREVADAVKEARKPEEGAAGSSGSPEGPGGTVDPGLLEEAARTVSTMRTILGMARATLEAEERPGGIPPDEARNRGGFRRELRRAEDAVEEVQKAIVAALGDVFAPADLPSLVAASGMPVPK